MSDPGSSIALALKIRPSLASTSKFAVGSIGCHSLFSELFKLIAESLVLNVLDSTFES